MGEDGKPKQGKPQGKPHPMLTGTIIGLILGVLLGWMIGTPGWFNESVRQPVFGAANEKKAEAIKAAGDAVIKSGEAIKKEGETTPTNPANK